MAAPSCKPRPKILRRVPRIALKGTLWRTPLRSWKVYNTFQVWGLLLCIVKYLHHPAFSDGSLCTVAFFDLWCLFWAQIRWVCDHWWRFHCLRRDLRSVVTEYSDLESVQPLRKDEAGNKTSKERVLSTLLVIGPSFGESCEIKADCYFVQVCCRWCCRTSVPAVGVKDVRQETTSSTPHTYAPAMASSRLWMCGGFCRVGSFPTWPGRCSISMRAVSARAQW